MKWAFVGNTGDGKTLACVIVITELRQKAPNREIYGNLHLEFKNSNYTPVMFLPFSQLKSCIVVYDDIDEDESYLKGFVSVSAKRSRKEFMDLFFTCQYYTQLPRKLRKMIDYRVVPTINKGIINLKIYKKKEGLISDKDYIAKDYYHLYDTYEVVDDPTESDILTEIAKQSKTPRDIEKNLMIYTGNRNERKTLYNEIYEMTEFGKKESEKKRKKQEKEAKLRKQRFEKLKIDLVKFLVDSVRLNESMTYLKGKLYQKLDNTKNSNLINENDFSEIIMRATATYQDKKFEENVLIEEQKISEEKDQNERTVIRFRELLYRGTGLSYREVEEKTGNSLSTVHSRTQNQINLFEEIINGIEDSKKKIKRVDKT